MSKVLEYPALAHAAAAAHFRNVLARSTDPSDVHAGIESGEHDFVVLDARSPQEFERGHVPGAVNIPHRQLDARSTARLPKDLLIVTYCDGIGCNASTKAALKLAELGFAVKEMLGGLNWWRRDGYTVEIGETSGERENATGEAARNAAGEAAKNAAGEAAKNTAGEAARNVGCGC
jgi:rhodanese-related sulfurtransferase